MSKPEDEDMLAATPLESSTMDEQPLELSAGDRLKQARLARQFELRDVAEQTRQSQDTLAALESMQTAHIAPSILRLQAKSYARFLGLPENEIAGAFAEGRGSINTEAMPTHAPPVARSRKPLLIGAGFLGLAVLAIGGVSLLLQPSPQDDADPLAISARLAPAFANVTEVSSLSASVEESFSIRATKRAWIEVRGSDGTVFRNREMAVGESYFPRTGAGWTITVRDGAAFEWRLGDLVVEPVGEPQEALYSVSVDSALAAANTARSAALAQAPGGFDAPR